MRDLLRKMYPLQTVVYVAGPYRDRLTGPNGTYNYKQQVDNVRNSEALAFRVWSELQGKAVAICPHLNNANWQGSLPESVWINGDMELIRRCDCLLLAEGWEDSEGTLAEVEFAKNLNIPIYYDFWELDNAVHEELDEAENA